MSQFTFQVKYTSLGDVTVEADTEEEALEKAGRKLKLMQDLGDIGSDREFISWSGDEVELDGEELDGYFDD